MKSSFQPASTDSSVPALIAGLPAWTLKLAPGVMNMGSAIFDVLLLAKSNHGLPFGAQYTLLPSSTGVPLVDRPPYAHTMLFLNVSTFVLHCPHITPLSPDPP